MTKIYPLIEKIILSVAVVIFCQGDGTYLDKKESCDRENHSITGAGLSLAKG